ncbi:cystic fibrosis transmembrane conductance regulator [Elysia marginata]|uniref:Cystic fibrosis transmembrane conductance regulator n=1 Tax=Elysia marginata TaxID=1093978 RepID=A0AAV4JY98_9GAST|nr:cystic fibrosis transmembrane conductance regulator [Elysia marginata]
MDESLRHENPNPALTANPLSQFFFCWINSLFEKGYKGWLEESDMYNVCPNDSSKAIGDEIQADWEEEVEQQRQGKQASLLRTLYRVFGLRFLLLSLILLAEELVKLAQPFLLAEFLDYFSPGGKTSSTEAWLYATGVVLCSVTIALLHHPYYFAISRTGMRARIGLCSMMYRKSLRLSNKSMSQSSVGQIVNLMSNDVSRFDQDVAHQRLSTRLVCALHRDPRNTHMSHRRCGHLGNMKCRILCSVRAHPNPVLLLRKSPPQASGGNVNNKYKGLKTLQCNGEDMTKKLAFSSEIERKMLVAHAPMSHFYNLVERENYV